ncbi:MAG: FixH family protein [Bacteroidota bacterium]
MNWGNKIALVFVCFASFIGYMVVRAFKEDFDLVAEDYYAREIQYESKLLKLANTQSKGKKVDISQTKDQVVLKFSNATANGTIQFYHPSRKMFDKTYEIQLQNSMQLIPKSALVSGHYRINVSWEVGDQEYLQESKIFIR